jgi:hypothetical protein
MKNILKLSIPFLVVVLTSSCVCAVLPSLDPKKDGKENKQVDLLLTWEIW